MMEGGICRFDDKAKVRLPPPHFTFKWFLYHESDYLNHFIMTFSGTNGGSFLERGNQPPVLNSQRTDSVKKAIMGYFAVNINRLLLQKISEYFLHQRITEKYRKEFLTQTNSLYNKRDACFNFGIITDPRQTNTKHDKP